MSATPSTVIIAGASDDLIEIDGKVPGCDEYYADSDDSGTFVLSGPAGTARVRVTYGDSGVWEITVAQTGEDAPMLPVSITGDGYTFRATFQDVSLVVREHTE